MVTLILAICLVCPLVDMFDFWDRTPQTGTDTEYTLVIVGLCVGAMYTLARVVLQISARSRFNHADAMDVLVPAFMWNPVNRIQALISASPPPTTLRI
jgi:hypothetical protein